MNLYRTLRAGLRSLVRREIVERELDDELRHFEEMDAEERMRTGVPPNEARHAARVRVGGVSTRERVIDGGWEAHVDRVWKDVRHGWRGLVRNPGFATVAVLTLALGIGANTAMFSVVNAVILRSLPYRDADRLTMLFTADARRGLEREETALPTIMDWRTQSRAFDDVAYFSAHRVSAIAPTGERTVTLRAYVSGNLFATLGAAPQIGRTISTRDQAERALVAVISHGFWQRQFAGAPDVIGKVLRLDDPATGGVLALTVIGVMPADFFFPNKHTYIWVPASTLPGFDSERGDRFTHASREWTAVGRLARGVDPDDARGDLGRLATRLTALYPAGDPDFPGFAASVVPMLDYVADARTQTALWLLLGAVGLVLLVACANVANLLLARGATRQGELALRRALGAGRARLVRQLITEDIVLVALGGGLGLLLGLWATRLLRAWAGPFVPRVDEMTVDWRVLLFAGGIATLSAFVFGLIPALRLSSGQAADALRGDGSRGTATLRLKRQRGTLVMLECALAVCLLAGAGLLLRSLLLLEDVNPGFDPNGVLAARLVLPMDTVTRVDARLQQLNDLTSRLDALPGVQSVGFIDDMFISHAVDASITIPGRPGTIGELVQSAVTPGFFETLRVPLRLGRYPERTDASRAMQSVSINEAFAKRYFPNENPIGRRFCTGPAGTAKCYEIVGVLGDMRRQSLEKAAVPQYFVLYLPRAQGRVDMLVRVGEAAHGVETAVRRVAAAAFPGITVASLTTLDQELGDFGAQRRFLAGLLTMFAALALVLAAVGIFGVVLYSVSERRREIGVRMALGATAHDVLRAVVLDGMRQPLLGIAIGVAVALAATHVLRSLLFGVNATDAATFAAVVILLVSVAGVACLAAALRAVRIDPVDALR